MRSHPNARLTQKGRLRLVTQYLEHGRSPCFTYRWLAQYRAGGPTSLADRSAAPGPLLHHRQGTQPTGSGPSEEAGAQASRAALRVGATGRPDPRGRQTEGFCAAVDPGLVPESRAPEHRRVPTGDDGQRTCLGLQGVRQGLPQPGVCGASAPGRTRPEPTAKPRDSSRRSAASGPTPWPSRTGRIGTAGCPAPSGFISASGRTRPWAGAHLSSGPLSCAADEPGETPP